MVFDLVVAETARKRADVRPYIRCLGSPFAFTADYDTDMAPYQYELPTTGAISFTDICIDGTGSYTVALVEATTARANLRSILKEHKHGAGEKDYLRIIKV